MTIANITWLTDDIATGGDFSYLPHKAAQQLKELLDMNVGMVIDCRAEANDTRVWRNHDVTYVWLPTDDRDGHHIPAEHFDTAVVKARQAREFGRTVFAHCHMGVNRGPSTAMAILMDRGYSPIEAFDLIREKRPIAAIWYAEDAIRAHYTRAGWTKAHISRKLNEFRRHRNLVFTAKERAATQHAIREHHARDSQEWKRVMAR